MSGRLRSNLAGCPVQGVEAALKKGENFKGINFPGLLLKGGGSDGFIRVPLLQRDMERDTIRTAWVEGQIDDDGIALTLLTEDSNGAVIEAVDHFTFEELQDMSGEMFSLNLSQSAEEALSEQRQEATIGKILQSENLSEKVEELPEKPSSKELLAYMGFLDTRHHKSEDESKYEMPQVGDMMRDTGDLPSWSEDRRVRVIEVTDIPAKDYTIDGDTYGRTVADFNPSEPEDAPVVVANYVGATKEYSFPVTRLESLH